MTVQSTGSGFVWQCDRCHVRLTSQTKAVVQQRLAEHREGCK
jgi:hypothetical protein